MKQELRIKETHIYTLPATTGEGYELHIVKVRALVDGQKYEPNNHQSVRGGFLYDSGNFIGRVPANETTIFGPWVDPLESYDYQRPVFIHGYPDCRWVPVRRETR